MNACGHIFCKAINQQPELVCLTGNLRFVLVYCPVLLIYFFLHFLQMSGGVRKSRALKALLHVP